VRPVKGMIEASLFDRARIDDLKQALNVYARRQRVVAENIANVETEGFRAKEYRFEDLLRGAAAKRVEGQRTHAAHLPVGRSRIEDTQGEVIDQESGFDNGINDVDIDREMTSLATTELSYRMATRLLSMKYNLLREAVSGRVR